MVLTLLHRLLRKVGNQDLAEDSLFMADECSG